MARRPHNKRAEGWAVVYAELVGRIHHEAGLMDARERAAMRRYAEAITTTNCGWHEYALRNTILAALYEADCIAAKMKQDQ